jgi:CubicO group peptidase (beta-lactamase class C family)
MEPVEERGLKRNMFKSLILIETMKLVALLCALCAHSAHGDLTGEIEAAIQPIVEIMAKKYNCSFSVGLYGGSKTAGFNAKAAAGVIDRAAGTKTDTADTFVWGSVTKVLTGTGVLRLIDSDVVGLNDTIPQHIDPFIKKMKAADPSLNFSSLQDLFGTEVSKVQVVDLLGMKSGVPDYDTAIPMGKHPSDTFRALVYADPKRNYTPADLLNEPYVHTGKLDFSPGICDKAKYYNCYSSTNYVLLGLLLANHAGVDSWADYKQADIIKSVYR